MKASLYAFKKPVTVLQIFRHIYTDQKEQKSFNDRTELAQWTPMSSKSGYVLANQLYLPESILEEPHFANCNLLTIEDNNTSYHHTLPNIYPKKITAAFSRRSILNWIYLSWWLAPLLICIWSMDILK